MPDPHIGVTIAHYRILEKLGEGGMGVVYQARDTHLDRLVAIKVLPADTADPERKRRFIQEAKSASALNHPHIVTVHDVASADGVDYIVMECVSGKTLAELIGRKGLKLRDVLAYGAQIADALAAAHRVAIVHRDLKPGNVMVTETGQVKVLDFGLAKLTEVEPDASADATTMARLPKTEEGRVVGTAAYMSPEQAEGKLVDTRSDIFSFGAVLYEMLTGRRAFAAQTTVSTLSAILHQEPLPLEGTPPALDTIIRRCLRKDPERRVQHIVDVKLALEDLKEESDSGTLVTPAALQSKPRVSRWVIAATAVLGLAAVLAVGAMLSLRSGAGSDAPRQELKPVKLTANPSEYPISGAALAPDGRFLAYSDPQGIHLRLLGTGETDLLPGTEGLIVTGWSIDGAKVTARRQAGGEAASYWSISIVGTGSRRPVMRGLAAPDGSASLFVDREDLWIEGAGGRRRLGALDSSDCGCAGRPDQFAWSQDSKRVILFRGLPPAGSGQNELVAIDVALGREEILAPKEQLPRFIQTMAWAGDHRIIFAAPEFLADARPTNQSDVNLWELRLDTKAPARRLTNWTGFHIGSLSITPDGKRLSFLETKYQNDVWVAGIEAENQRLVNPRRLTLDEREDWPTGWTSDSRSVLFTSNRLGTDDVFAQDVQGGAAELLAGGSGIQTGLRPTGDGRWILYWDDPSGRLMRVARPGATPEAAGPAPGIVDYRCGLVASSSCIVVEPDGPRAYAVRQFDPIAGVGRVLFQLPTGLEGPAPSPTTDRFAYLTPSEPGRPHNLIRIVSANGALEREFAAVGATNLNSLDYSADGKGLFSSDYSTDLGARLLYIAMDGRVTVLWSNRASLRTWAVPSPDGKWVAMLGSSQESNVWTLERF